MADSSTSEAEQVPEKSSRCITEIVTGTFNFEVTNWRQIRGTPVGEFISSRDFRVAGYDWRINFYPNGMDADSAGSASAYVQLASQGQDARAKFTLSVLERDGQATVASHDAMEMVYSQDSNNWGFPQFVPKSKLKSLSRHGGFTIRCVLTIMNDSPPLELLGHLERMLQEGTGADITFGVGGRDFRAHRCLLAARSPEFDKQISGLTTRKDMPRVEVVDMDATTFEMMLHYIYTDSMPCSGSSDDEGDHSDTVYQHLLVAADRYGLERLKMMCEEEVCKRMDVETVMARFLLAKQHSCKLLKDACVEFMSSSPEVLGVVLENVNFKDA